MRNMVAAVVIATLLGACGRTEDAPVRSAFPAAIRISPTEEALTFARILTAGRRELLAVGTYSGDQIVAYNLTQALGGNYDDPVSAFNALGYDGLRERIDAGLREAPIRIAISDLVMPVDLKDAHIAAGTNFAAHAEESAVEDGPFLFAKLVKPTPFRAPVAAGEGLLDYETELAFVTLTNTPLPELPRYMGLILVNDFTDRAALLRNANPADVTSGDGFTTGKSAEGYLPVGNLFVIPRELESFVEGVELSLSVNGELRQKGGMTLAIWDIRELLRQIHLRQDARWLHLGKEVRLPVDQSAIPERTMILAGTPAGTVFAGISKSTMARGLLKWLAGGWGKPIAHHVVEGYIADAKAGGGFLKAGDHVDIHVERLGTIETTIGEQVGSASGSAAHHSDSDGAGRVCGQHERRTDRPGPARQSIGHESVHIDDASFQYADESFGEGIEGVCHCARFGAYMGKINEDDGLLIAAQECGLGEIVTRQTESSDAI